MVQRWSKYSYYCISTSSSQTSEPWCARGAEMKLDEPHLESSAPELSLAVCQSPSVLEITHIPACSWLPRTRSYYRVRASLPWSQQWSRLCRGGCSTCQAAAWSSALWPLDYLYPLLAAKTMSNCIHLSFPHHFGSFGVFFCPLHQIRDQIQQILLPFWRLA